MAVSLTVATSCDAPTPPAISNRPPATAIVAPEPGARFQAGEAVQFQASVSDPEDGELAGESLVWTLNSETVGTGTFLTVIDLSEGKHRVTLTATDSEGAVGNAEVEIVVYPAALTLGEPVGHLDGARNETERFTLTLPEQVEGDPVAGATLRFRTAGQLGDVELLVLHDRPATADRYDCRSDRLGSEELCTIPAPAPGTWHVTLVATEEYRGVGLLAELRVGAERPCSLRSPDSDGDRLPDCVETNTGEFVSMLNTGTDPADPDTDDDGLLDGDEVLGTVTGVELPAMGVSPLRGDILMEYDWTDDAAECGAHSHRPRPVSLEEVTALFEQGPVSNPDGSTGLNVVHDYGQGDPFTGGTRIDAEDPWLTVPDRDRYRATHFTPARRGFFHHVLVSHATPKTGIQGIADYPGATIDLTLGCGTFERERWFAFVLAHELGHNLGLHHGGFESLNLKPNYNSVMNNLYLRGIDTDCRPGPEGVQDDVGKLAYSRGVRPTLDETDLREPDGLCGAAGPAWDWNKDGDATDVGIAADINRGTSGRGDGKLGILRDHDDWANLILAAVRPGGTGALLRGNRTVCELARASE